MAKHHTNQEVLNVLTRAARPWGDIRLRYSSGGAYTKLRQLASAGAIVLEDEAGVIGRPKIIRARIVRENV